MLTVGVQAGQASSLPPRCLRSPSSHAMQSKVPAPQNRNLKKRRFALFELCSASKFYGEEEENLNQDLSWKSRETYISFLREWMSWKSQWGQDFGPDRDRVVFLSKICLSRQWWKQKFGLEDQGSKGSSKITHVGGVGSYVLWLAHFASWFGVPWMGFRNRVSEGSQWRKVG